jgi:hypothetical protein
LRTFKRKLLGIVTETTISCSNNNAPIGIGGYTAVGCNSIAEKYVPAGTLLPTANTSSNTYFEFFNSGGTLSTNSATTAQSLSLQGGVENGVQQYCNNSCGDSYFKSIDFTYANMFPGTIKI